jgi:cytochrome P450 / NADPH-cytochrome P450 reductase
MTSLARIPEPPETFLLGHLLTLSADNTVQDLIRLARELGPIFRLEIRGRVAIIVSGFELVDELSDEKRFDKAVRGALKIVRGFGGDGLFTAKTSEPNWSKAHNILLPNFSHKAMLSYHPMMLDIAEQLVLKWERLNPGEDIEVTRDMTSLTVDTIGLTGFDFRFNSFYHDKEHPFVAAMADALGITMDKLRDVPGESLLRSSRDRQLQDDIRTMNETVDRIIKDRRASGEDASGKSDMLSCMFTGVDRKTGEKLDDLNMRYQVITFLIAGHETTSGLLSFAIYALLKHPEVLAKAYDEVDRVLGADLSARPTYAQVNQLHYITQILKETLRLWPTAPAYGIAAKEETIIGGKYKIKPHHNVSILLPMLHRDKSVWGENAEVFNPDNFTAEAEAKRPANAYKPFGNGQRACIGRQFALHEATLVLGMMLQRFKLIDHTNYELKIKETLTMKPDNFKIRVRLRTPEERKTFEQLTVNSKQLTASHQSPATSHQQGIKHETPLLVLFGSNMGTAEELARRMAQDGEDNGFVTKVAPLDDYVGRLPKEGLVVIVTASYNGLPPDNAVEFCEWLRSDALNAESLQGVKYAVFGCGNRDWVATFQAIPRLIDERMAACGATRIVSLGEGDAREDFDGQFQKWYKPARLTVANAFNLTAPIVDEAKPLYKLEIVPGTQPSPFVDSFDAQPMKVIVNRELHRTDGAHASDRSTRHIELQLPAGVTYRAGDHLGVIPHNGAALVNRVMARFGFEPGTHVRLRRTTNRKSFLPTDRAISVTQLLSDYVELQDVATRSQIQTLIEYTECPPHRIQLQALAQDDERYKEEVLTKRKSALDLLEEYPACTLPFEVYLEMLPPLHPRYYSISSSPLVAPNACSITVAVIEAPARSGRGTFTGVATNYLRHQSEGSVLYAFVKDTKSTFRLPDDPATPIIMIGPGTGFAPFRGFLQERAALKAQGQTIGASLLFFGCRHPEQDFIYEDELRQFEADGITQVATAFSRIEGEKKCYVQDELYARRDEVWTMLEAGAVVYVCGDASRMAPDVRRTFAAIVSEKINVNAKEAERFVNNLAEQNRYLADVWASN